MRKFEARELSGIRWLTAVGMLAFLPTAVLSGATEATDRGATVSWDVVNAVTTLSLDSAMLSNLGVETTVAGNRVLGHAKHPLSVIPDGALSFAADVDSNLRGVIGWDGFRGFEEGGVLRHRGGVTLRRGSRTLDFADFELKAGARAGDLEFVDARGVAYLATAAAQWVLDTDGRQLRYMNADVRVLPAFAEWLGDARYADMTVGVLDLDASLSGGPIPPSPTPEGAVPPCGDWSGSVDVGIGQHEQRVERRHRANRGQRSLGHDRAALCGARERGHGQRPLVLAVHQPRGSAAQRPTSLPRLADAPKLQRSPRADRPQRPEARFSHHQPGV